MIKEDGKYWIFENGNKYTKSKFTKELATCLNRTLINCKNCIDCERCNNCDSCNNCEGCHNIFFKEDCKDWNNCDDWNSWNFKE